MNTGALNKVCYILPRLLKTSFKKDPTVFSLIINAIFFMSKTRNFNVRPKTQNISNRISQQILPYFFYFPKKKPLSFVISGLTPENKKKLLKQGTLNLYLKTIAGSN